ncbi:hypothetical protein RUM44_003297 [Polyplax serrata]|uniref:GRIP domain-containing protein n=1 Tax=Polyplax serrata TaxID=468196 RepID=A0ABR1AG23_POLSC
MVHSSYHYGSVDKCDLLFRLRIMFWHLKNRIKEETGNDVDLMPSIVNSNQPKPNKEKHSNQGSTTSLESFTIDSSMDDGSSLDMKLADGKILTPKQFKKLESKEDEWRRKLQKKEEELAARLKKADETWKKQFDDLEREMRNELEKKETEKKSLESERYSLQAKILKLEESSKLAAEYKKKICQFQEDMDQLQGFQTQEMAKIKHLLLVKEQELAEKDQALKESTTQVKSLKAEVLRLQNFENQYESIQDEIERMRHGFDLEKTQLTCKLAEKEEDVRHLKDKLVLLEERVNSGPIGEMTVDERVQKLLCERALFERRLEEAHLHLSQIKSSWSGKIESLETQVGRLCRQASEESTEKRQVEMERDHLKAKVTKLEMEYEESKSKWESKANKLEKLKLEKAALEDEIKNLKLKTEEDVLCLKREIKSLTDNVNLIERNLTNKSKENNDKDDLIKELRTQLDTAMREKNYLEVQLTKLEENVNTQKRASEGINQQLKKERREKDEMMMRNAQISQEVELSKQELRKQEMETSELHSKIRELESSLKDKQKDSDSAKSYALELEDKIRKLEIIQKDQESNSTLEQDLKTKILQLESEVLVKNKNLKVMQQRLSELKKTLQRELKVPATAIDPGGPDSELHSIATSFGSSASGALQSSPSQQSTSSPRFRNEETLDEAPDDVNFRYLKHVLIKFLTSRECEAQHLTRAVATLLRFSAEEERLLKETLEWKMSWFGTRPNLGNGQTAKTIPPR